MDRSGPGAAGARARGGTQVTLAACSDTGEILPPLPCADLDAEGELLSTLLVAPQALARVTPILQARHFYADANRQVYAAIVSLSDAGRPVDTITIAHALRPTWPEVTSYLHDVLGRIPATGAIEEYARIIRRCYVSRCALDACRAAVARLEIYHDPDEVIRDLGNAFREARS